MRKTVILTAAALFLTFTAVMAQTNDTKYKEVLKTYMEVSGTNASFNTVMDQVVKAFAPNESEAKIKEITVEIAPKAMSSLIDLMTPIYAKHLSLPALEEAVKFFSSPAGQEIARSQSPIAVESMQMAQQWAMGLNEMIIQAIKK